MTDFECENILDVRLKPLKVALFDLDGTLFDTEGQYTVFWGGIGRKYRPDVPIISCTTDEYVRRQTNMSWGVVPLVIDEKTNSDDLFTEAANAAKKAGFVNDGDTVVLTAGVPLGVSGTTNLMRVEVIK